MLRLNLTTNGHPSQDANQDKFLLILRHVIKMLTKLMLMTLFHQVNMLKFSWETNGHQSLDANQAKLANIKRLYHEKKTTTNKVGRPSLSLEDKIKTNRRQTQHDTYKRLN